MTINLAQFSSKDPRYQGGFGQGAYDRARAAGLTDAQIRSALPSSGLKIGTTIGAKLGGSTSLYNYRNQAIGGGFGIGSYNRAIAAGMTPHNIRQSLASSGLRIGDKAAEALNINPGMTYLGYSPNVQQAHVGASGNQYSARAIFASRGYGLNNPTFSSDKGYSPTFYISGGANDYDAVNFLFGTDYQGGPNVGTGYSDPKFHKVENKAAADLAANMSILPTPSLKDFDFSMPAFNYSIPGGSSRSSVSGVRSAASSRNTSSSSLGQSIAGGMQIKNVNV